MKTIIALLGLFLIVGCHNSQGVPAMASVPYPTTLHTSNSVSIQVTRDGDTIEIVNSTATDYEGGLLWINQRFSTQLPPLFAGSTLKVNLWLLRDSYGQQLNAGGFWRTDRPTPLVLAELQTGEDSPLVGLVVIREE